MGLNASTVSKVFHFRSITGMIPESRIARWLITARGKSPAFKLMFHPGFCAMQYVQMAKLSPDVTFHPIQKESGFLLWSLRIDVKVINEDSNVSDEDGTLFDKTG